MKKVVMILVIVVIILAICFTLISVWVSGFQKDTEETKAMMNEILDSYDDFNSSVDEFSNKRNSFYGFKENLYLEELATNTDGWNTFMNEYKEVFQKVYDTSEVLRENCTIEYGDVNVNSKCTTFKANFEAAVNYYISDVNSYNLIVDEYNAWNTSGTYPVLNKASYVVYEDYIDYDEDGEYFGKEEVAVNE